MPQEKIKSAVRSALNGLGLAADLSFKIDIPTRQEFGDYSTNAAILAAKRAGRAPRELAAELAALLSREELFRKVEIAGPGFINFFLSDSFLHEKIRSILNLDKDWGHCLTTQPPGSKILLEYVSANPTGPLHVGHGRWAVIGDVISRLLKAAGYPVTTEFYVNNVGNQVEKLYASVLAARAGKPVPEGGYGGAYVKDIPGADQREMLANILAEQQRVLGRLGVSFDHFFFESELHQNEQVKWCVEKLHDLGKTFEEGGAIWFKASEYGDDKDRVLVREDGQTTYFAADIAYHLNKFQRGFDQLIDIWGTDHHGYINRLKAALKALGQPVEKFEIIIGQLVTLYRGDEPIRMSKRTGEMVTLQEVIEEIGADAVRFFFSATDVNSHLDFDLELAKKKTLDNPVYYLQYAHARICSILRKSEIPSSKSESIVDLSALTEPAEKELILKLIAWPDTVAIAARLRQPHRITEYGKELAIVFHSFYEKCRVLGNPARLVLVDASRITLRNVLELLGITAPEAM